MEKIIAACGNDCMACPRYVAHPWEKTDEQLRHTAELWMKIGYRDHIVTNEEISCTGCKPENWCRYQVVKCCQNRGIKTCADCQEYPCDIMKECFQVTKSFEPKCREVCSEEEYLQLKRAFFEKEENLGEFTIAKKGIFNKKTTHFSKFQEWHYQVFELYGVWIYVGDVLGVLVFTIIGKI